MLRFNRVREPIHIDEAYLSHRAVSRLLTVLTAGVLLLLFDLMIGFDFSSLDLGRSGGCAYLTRPEEGSSPGHISLRADIKTDSGTISKEYDLSLYSYSSGRSGGVNSDEASGSPSGTMSEDELLAYEMRSLISSLNDDRSTRRVSLPDHLRTGEEITWSKDRNTNTGIIALGMILLAVFIYVRRFDPLEKIRKAQADSIRRQLPEFTNRLVLLLGAGLVLSSAFERAVEDNPNRDTGQDYFYSRMAEISDRIKETNGSMAEEFKAFAKSAEGPGDGSRELIRISNIINDNISKGVELTDKLQSESELLWLARKRACEERGRLAETKLTMPLTVFLLVLVVLTVSPALLEL